MWAYTLGISYWWTCQWSVLFSSATLLSQSPVRKCCYSGKSGNQLKVSVAGSEEIYQLWIVCQSFGHNICVLDMQIYLVPRRNEAFDIVSFVKTSHTPLNSTWKTSVFVDWVEFWLAWYDVPLPKTKRSCQGEIQRFATSWSTFLHLCSVRRHIAQLRVRLASLQTKRSQLNLKMLYLSVRQLSPSTISQWSL